VAEHLTVIIEAVRPPGLYRWRSRAHPAAIRRELAAADATCHVLDGARIVGAASLFDVTAAVLRFPDWFCGGWADLAECLADLSWLGGRLHVVIWEHYGTLAHHDERAWETARDVFALQATASGKDGAPLYVLLRGTGPVAEVPVL
jgi:Barstar (barnase inhibitor)